VKTTYLKPRSYRKHGAIQPTTNGNYIKCEYWVDVHATVTCSGGIRIDIPITIYAPQPPEWVAPTIAGWQPQVFTGVTIDVNTGQAVPMAAAVPVTAPAGAVAVTTHAAVAPATAVTVPAPAAAVAVPAPAAAVAVTTSADTTPSGANVAKNLAGAALTTALNF